MRAAIIGISYRELSCTSALLDETLLFWIDASGCQWPNELGHVLPFLGAPEKQEDTEKLQATDGRLTYPRGTGFHVCGNPKRYI
jgi:hypothetical protein